HAALLERSDFGDRIGRELFNIKADALLLGINIEHFDLNILTLLEVLNRFIAGLVPGEIREMDHAVDIAGQADEQTEFSDVADFTFQHGSGWILFSKCYPGIVNALFQTEADAAF